MLSQTNLKRGLLTSSILILSACGGGGSSTSTPTPPPSSGSGGETVDPVGKTIVGPISGFGSIIVNGTRYNTDRANFTIDGKSGTQADLKVGQIVVLKSDDQNVAQSVRYEEIVEGPIANLDISAETFTILGQTIIVDNLTSFDDDISPNDISGLSDGLVVEISGERDASGNILATRIEKSGDQSGNNYELHGFVGNLDTAAQTFAIGNQKVGYANAVLEDFGSSGIQNGDFVEVEGAMFTNDGTFLATKVENENDDKDERDGDEDDEAEIYGVITGFESAERFTIGSNIVVTDDNTEFKNGRANNLAVNVSVEVEGRFNAFGELVAKKIEFEEPAEIEVSSTIEAIDTTNQTLTLAGITFTITDTTRFEDKYRGASQTFSFNDLSVGDYVEIDGYADANGTMVASKIEREDGDYDDDGDGDSDGSEIEIEGPVSSIDSESFVILGRTVLTTATTEFEIDEQNVTASEFFSVLAVNDLVEVEGLEDGNGNILAKDVSLEEDDD